MKKKQTKPNIKYSESKLAVKNTGNCPTGPNQPKSQNLFHQKDPKQDFIRGTLIAAYCIVPGGVSIQLEFHRSRRVIFHPAKFHKRASCTAVHMVSFSRILNFLFYPHGQLEYIHFFYSIHLTSVTKISISSTVVYYYSAWYTYFRNRR